MSKDRLSDTDIVNLDYDGKVKLLEQITRQMMAMRLEFAQVSGKYAEIRANLIVLREVKSALQSAIKAEGG